MDAEAAKLLGLPHGEKEEFQRTLRLVELNGKVEGGCLLVGWVGWWFRSGGVA